MHNPPILVCADLQTEYLAQGCSHAIGDAGAIMPCCLELMRIWRDNLWPVMHLKRIAQAAWFNPASNLTNWISEFKPLPGELTFEHLLPSAYSSARFAEYMSNIRNLRCLLLGFSLDETILATAVDGFHPSHPSLRVDRRRARLPARRHRGGGFLQERSRQGDQQFRPDPGKSGTDRRQRPDGSLRNAITSARVIDLASS